METYNIKTMAELARVSMLNLRRHFDEKATTWLYNLSRGIEHEEVKERDLPKSIGKYRFTHVLVHFDLLLF